MWPALDHRRALHLDLDRLTVGVGNPHRLHVVDGIGSTAAAVAVAILAVNLQVEVVDERVLRAGFGRWVRPHEDHLELGAEPLIVAARWDGVDLLFSGGHGLAVYEEQPAARGPAVFLGKQHLVELHTAVARVLVGVAAEGLSGSIRRLREDTGHHLGR